MGLVYLRALWVILKVNEVNISVAWILRAHRIARWNQLVTQGEKLVQPAISFRNSCRLTWVFREVNFVRIFLGSVGEVHSETKTLWGLQC